MRSRLVKLMDEAGDRPIVGDLAVAVAEYAESVPERVKLARKLQALEEEIGAATLKRAKAADPSFTKRHADAWNKGLDDFALVGRTCIQAMLLDRVEELDSRLLDWQCDMYEQFGFRPDFVRACYSGLWEETRARLSAEEAAMIEPCFAHCVTRLAAIPEPA